MTYFQAGTSRAMKMLSNTPPQKDSEELWKHFSDTYFSLRLGLAALAVAFPVVLYLYGKLVHGLDLQPSMSAYFWAAETDQCATFPMRTIFVGFLFAIAVGLYVYKGLTPLENVLLNGAAVCASLVAIWPEQLTVLESVNDERVAQLFQTCPAVKAWAVSQAPFAFHYWAAIALFLLLAAVAWFCAEKSLEYLPAQHDAAKFRRGYKIMASLMLLFPVAGMAAAFALGLGSHMVFFIEAAGIWSFAAYWAVKSRELSLSELEKNPEAAIEHATKRQTITLQAAKGGAISSDKPIT